VTSGLAGLIPSNCSAIAIAMALLCLAALVAGVVVRPYNTPVKNHLMNMGSLFTFVAAVLIVVAVHHEDPATAKSYAQTGARLAIGATYFGVVSSAVTIVRFVLLRCTHSAMMARSPDLDGVQAALVSADVVELMDMAATAPPLRVVDAVGDGSSKGTNDAADAAAAEVDAYLLAVETDDEDVESLDLALDEEAGLVVGVMDAAATVPPAPPMSEADAELLFGAPSAATDTAELDALLYGSGADAPPAVRHDEHGRVLVDQREALRAGIEEMKRPDAFARFVADH
jgi:hypothetical protein